MEAKRRFKVTTRGESLNLLGVLPNLKTSESHCKEITRAQRLFSSTQLALT